jgi:hypothetical protein
VSLCVAAVERRREEIIKHVSCSKTAGGPIGLHVRLAEDE